MESWKRGRDVEVVPLSNVNRTEGPERGLGVRGLSRREFLRLAGVGAGAAALPGFLAGCGGEQQQQGSAPEVKSVEGKLTFWYWAESDAPGANQWMNETVKAYKEKKPDLEINVVPQSTDTLISSFQAAASAGQGPDIASQWATGPVLAQVWQDAVVPISDYVPQEEIDQWLNTNENVYNGKLWAMPYYIIGIATAYNKEHYDKAGLDPENPPQMWDDFLATCEELKKSGFTPFSIGNQDGYGGAWHFSNMELQYLNSLQEWVDAIIGREPLTDEKYTGWYELLNDLVQKGYYNESVNSLTLSRGHAIFSRGESAMSFGTDGIVRQWQQDLGQDVVGIMKYPKLAEGNLADAFNATQSISYFITSWSKNKEEAAAFLQFMHTPERMQRWYEQTGVGLADKRFDPSLIKDPVLRELYKWETTGPQVWLENYNPPQIDSEANLKAGQLIFSGSGTPQEAAQLWQSVAQRWRTQNPDDLKNWQSWHPEVSGT
jgi:raffinose/stachyose/melibiose transport system substrate-binding protein